MQEKIRRYLGYKMNSIQLEDYQRINNFEFLEWEQLRGCSIIITGGTGLIGSNLTGALAYISRQRNLGLKIILLVRNVDHADNLFGKDAEVDIIKYNLGERPEVTGGVDYIIHLASPTNSKYFTEKPVETITANIEGISALLEFARDKSIKKFIELSTMEVYGFPCKGEKVTEKSIGAFETMKARNSYPIAKIACEALCCAYHCQYNIPTVVMRATQTFGPGVRYDDNRVFAQFMRCVMEKKDIVLKSYGLTERSYLYTADAISGIVIGMLKAQAGNIYSLANPNTYCSIREMAELVAKKVAKDKIKVIFDIADDTSALGYADTLYMDLDIKKIKSLGWKPTIGLEEMFVRMIKAVERDHE